MRVLLIDDHATFRESIAIMVARARNDVSVEQASNIDDARALIDGLGPADLVVTELRLPPSTNAVRELHDANDRVTIVALSSDESSGAIASALRAGAAGYAVKAAGYVELDRALRRVLNGCVALPDSAHPDEQDRRLLHADAIVAAMSSRERTLLAWVLRGMSSRTIAGLLQEPEPTIQTLVQMLLARFGTTRRTEALRLFATLDIPVLGTGP